MALWIRDFDHNVRVSLPRTPWTLSMLNSVHCSESSHRASVPVHQTAEFTLGHTPGTSSSLCLLQGWFFSVTKLDRLSFYTHSLSLFSHTHMHAHTPQHVCGGQRTCGIQFSAQCGSWGSNSGHKFWQQVPLLTEQSHWPRKLFTVQQILILLDHCHMSPTTVPETQGRII